MLISSLVDVREDLLTKGRGDLKFNFAFFDDI